MTTSVIHIRLEEWESHDPDTGSPLRGMYLRDAGARETAQRLTDTGILVLDELRNGLRIRATSWRIQLGEIEITVRPKIADLPLLSLMRYAYGLRDLNLLTLTSFATTPYALQDLLVSQLVAEAEELITRGLHRRYERRQEALASPRGRVDLQAIARQGGLTNASIPSIYYPRLEDTLLNQVLLAGLYLGARLTTDVPLRTRIRRAANALEPTVRTIELDRNTYRRALARQMAHCRVPAGVDAHRHAARRARDDARSAGSKRAVARLFIRHAAVF